MFVGHHFFKPLVSKQNEIDFKQQAADKLLDNDFSYQQLSRSSTQLRVARWYIFKQKFLFG
jgi:hypothetical protein